MIPGGQGKEIRIDCGIVDDFPSITWYITRPGHVPMMILSNNTDYHQPTIGQLLILGVQARNEGLYHCNAGTMNQMGNVQHNITVLGMNFV